MNLLTKHGPPLLIILISCLSGLLAAPYLPDRVPVRWGLDGSITTYVDKQYGIYLNPAAMAVAYLFFSLIPYSDRRRVSELRSLGIYEPFRNTAVYVFALAQFMAIGIGLGMLSSSANYVTGVVSLLIALTSHALRSGMAEPLRPHLKWVESAGDVDTRRVCGRMYLVACVGLVGSLFAPWPLAWILVPAAIVVVMEKVRGDD